MKWFGTAFSELRIADRLSAPLNHAPYARTWPQREKALGNAYEIVACALSELEIAPRLTLEPVRMWIVRSLSCGRTFPLLSRRRSVIRRVLPPLPVESSPWILAHTLGWWLDLFI